MKQENNIFWQEKIIKVGHTIPLDFYTRGDVVTIARELLGKVLCTALPGGYTSGIIVETEAYNGRNDKACHAHIHKKTGRNQIMYKSGGAIYVYLSYGLHNLFNIVTNKEGLADAVLIRALHPLEGIDIMARRRNLAENAPNLTLGPGSLTVAMGINKSHYGLHVTGPEIWVEDRGIEIAENAIAIGPRIGIDSAGDDKYLPWRFWIDNNPNVSRPRKKFTSIPDLYKPVLPQ